ncbi:transketolase [Klebsiella pneumoniae]
MKMTESQKVAAAAWRIRRYALQMGEVQGQGYIGQALGYADVLATAFSHAMTYRPEDPEWEGRDRFLLSHGHYAIAYYAALLEAGIIPEAELETYGSDDSRLPMSGMATYTPGMEMSAAHYGLSNLINLVDVNKQQADGDSRKILGFEPLQDKWAAFGWYVQRVDGNDLPAVMAAFDNAKSYSGNQPRVILCDTLMGKGVPFLETRDKNHFIRVDADEWQKAIAVLDANKPEGVL